MTTIDQHTDPTAEQQLLRHQFSQGLRDIADWIDRNPELDLPYGVGSGACRAATFSIGILGDEETIPERFAAAVKALGAARSKVSDSGYMRVERTFAPGLVVDVWTTREQVCEAVVVGTEEVEREEVVTPAVTRTVTEKRDLIEWRCSPILTNAVGVADARASLREAGYATKAEADEARADEVMAREEAGL